MVGYYTFTHTRTQTCIHGRNRMHVLEGRLHDFSYVVHDSLTYVVHDSFTYVVRGSFLYVLHDLFFLTWDKWHSFKWGSFTYGKRLVHEFDKHNLYLWHYAFMCVTWDWFAGNTFISGTWLILVPGFESRVFYFFDSSSQDCRIYEWKSVHTILLTTTSTSMIESKCLFIGTFCIIKFKSAGNEATQDHQMQKCR